MVSHRGGFNRNYRDFEARSRDVRSALAEARAMVLGCLCDSYGRVVGALASAQQECRKAEEAVAMILFTSS